MKNEKQRQSGKERENCDPSVQHYSVLGTSIVLSPFGLRCQTSMLQLDHVGTNVRYFALVLHVLTRYRMLAIQMAILYVAALNSSLVMVLHSALQFFNHKILLRPDPLLRFTF